MEWAEILKAATTTAVVVGAIAWVARTTITHLFSRELEKTKIALKANHERELEKEKIDLKAAHDRDLQELKDQRVKELEEFRARNQTALGNFQTEAAERLQRAQAALDRAERLEADLIKSRGEGYGEIWKLTGSLNLFGPRGDVETEDLSAQLKNWYFENGWVLTDTSKRRYFLVQEILNFGMFTSISFRRPAGEELFSSPKRPVDVLRQLRSTLLNVEGRGDEGSYAVSELALK